MENAKQMAEQVIDFTKHNAQVIFSQFHKEWQRVICLFNNNLATGEEVYEVYHKYAEMAAVFHCYEEYEELLIRNGIKEG